MIVMTKCRVLFLVGLMVSVGGCDGVSPSDNLYCANISKCLHNVKHTAFPCIDEEDIRIRLSIIREKMQKRRCFTCAEYQTLFCREMLKGY